MQIDSLCLTLSGISKNVLRCYSKLSLCTCTRDSARFRSVIDRSATVSGQRPLNMGQTFSCDSEEASTCRMITGITCQGRVSIRSHCCRPVGSPPNTDQSSLLAHHNRPKHGCLQLDESGDSEESHAAVLTAAAAQGGCSVQEGPDILLLDEMSRRLRAELQIRDSAISALLKRAQAKKV